ncbi:MAG: AAA family ATPase [Clostridia bacterium]|nr:AAA family ATPase [Clostridia bacterium]
MTPEKEKTTVPGSLVGASAGQPNDFESNNSIPDCIKEINEEDEISLENLSMEELEAMYQKALRLSDPAFLPTITMNELYENVYAGRPPVIDGLLYSGTYLFVGAPKVGKSFFMAQLAYHVSTGQMLWQYPVHQSTVLYLALEDDYRRLQERLFRMFGAESTENLHFSISAKHMNDGLDEQLHNFMKEHPDTKLIIVDTLQKVRESGGESYSYANDYEIVGRLKQFADSYGICMLLVHHTRKQSADDRFDMISGTNGLLGAADGAFLLQKEKRTDNTATLEVAGRDQQDQKLHLVRDMDRLTWELERTETELRKVPPDPLLEKIAAVLTAENPSWTGSATELALKIDEEIQPNILTRKLNVKAGELRSEYRIEYQSKRSRNGSIITLTLSEGQV